MNSWEQGNNLTREELLPTFKVNSHNSPGYLKVLSEADFNSNMLLHLKSWHPPKFFPVHLQGMKLSQALSSSGRISIVEIVDSGWVGSVVYSCFLEHRTLFSEVFALNIHQHLSHLADGMISFVFLLPLI